jgi:hypothetical protein
MAQPPVLTLTDVTHYGRIGVKVAIILLVVLIFGRVLLSALVNYWVATHPPAPPAPTMGFGLLPLIEFPEQTTENKPVSYSLELPTGEYPEFGDRAKVFLMTKASPSLLDDQSTKTVAASLGFVFEPEVLDATTYRFNRSQPLNLTLEIDTQTKRFSMTSDFLSRPELITDPNLPSESQSVSLVKAVLSSADLLAADMATPAGEVTYLKAVGPELAPAVSFSDASFAEVSLKRAPIDGEFEFYSPDGKAPISAILSGALKNKDSLVSLIYRYQSIAYDQVETYPLRSPNAAWKLLQAGEGYIANKGLEETAIIRRIVLGYFENYQDQDYMQPVYVFIGDDGFLGYIPALDSTSYQKP